MLTTLLYAGGDPAGAVAEDRFKPLINLHCDVYIEDYIEDYFKVMTWVKSLLTGLATMMAQVLRLPEAQTLISPIRAPLKMGAY